MQLPSPAVRGLKHRQKQVMSVKGGVGLLLPDPPTGRKVTKTAGAVAAPWVGGGLTPTCGLSLSERENLPCHPSPLCPYEHECGTVKLPLGLETLGVGAGAAGKTQSHWPGSEGPTATSGLHVRTCTHTLTLTNSHILIIIHSKHSHI